MTSRADPDGGSVTAETAVVLPSLVLVLAVCVWVASLVLTQLRAVEAARAGARAAARGETGDAVQGRVRDSLDGHGAVTVTTSGDSAVVRVTLVRSPGGLLGSLLPDVTVHATATAALEPGEAAT